MGPHSDRHLSPLEGQWADNVTRERRLLRDHPEWMIERHKTEGWPMTAPTTYKATNGVVTLTSDDLGALLGLIERAMREGV
jgi:hypothetical protein